MDSVIQSPAETARTLAEGGQIAEALAVLESASRNNDPDALMQLGVWYLAGRLVGRNPEHARQLIRQAVEIGHVDGALMEVALIANGSFGSSDWPAALALLETAAEVDYVAKEQLAMVRRMAIDANGFAVLKPEPRQLSHSPNLVIFEKLFSAEECAHIAQVAQPLLEPSVIVDPATGQFRPDPVRLSDGAVIGPAREDLVIRAINAKLAAISGSSLEQGEPLSVLRYAPGQQYRPHLDTFASTTNQRIKTVIVYLNQGYGGGQTRFDAIDLNVAGSAGDAILYTNVRDDGTPDPMSRHAGLPVTSGNKWIATRWIRKKPIDPWTMGQD